MTTVKKTASKRRQKIPKKTPQRPKKKVAKKREPKVKKERVARTRNANSLTESEFFGKIRNALRNIARFWKPAAIAKQRAKRNYIGPNKRQKVEFVCNRCKKGFPITQIQAHHVVECGTLKCYDDLPGFVERMFTEDIDSYEVLCLNCHKSHHSKKII